MKKDYAFQDSKKIIIKEKGKITQVDMENITHYLCDDYVITIHIRGSSIKHYTTQTLNEIEENLRDDGFFRISRNCIVNLRNVISFINTKRTIELYEGLELQVSRNKCHVLRKHLLE